MSLVTVSEKRDRIYPRRFDHEEAQRLRAEGWTYPDLADHFEKQMSEFVVLCQNGKGLVELGRVEAVSRQHAVEEVAQEPGEYMALKADLLKPFKVEPVTRLSVVREEA